MLVVSLTLSLARTTPKVSSLQALNGHCRFFFFFFFFFCLPQLFNKVGVLSLTGTRGVQDPVSQQQKITAAQYPQ